MFSFQTQIVQTKIGFYSSLLRWPQGRWGTFPPEVTSLSRGEMYRAYIGRSPRWMARQGPFTTRMQNFRQLWQALKLNQLGLGSVFREQNWVTCWSCSVFSRGIEHLVLSLPHWLRFDIRDLVWFWHLIGLLCQNHCMIVCVCECVLLTHCFTVIILTCLIHALPFSCTVSTVICCCMSNPNFHFQLSGLYGGRNIAGLCAWLVATASGEGGATGIFFPI